MRIFVFKSEVKQELRAFTDDISGSRLPSQFRPWTATGVITQDKELPYRLSRDDIEKSIGEAGFQLWRLKPKTEGSAN